MVIATIITIIFNLTDVFVFKTLKDFMMDVLAGEAKP